MKTVDFGTTGLRCSRLGLGTVELGLPYGLSKESPPDDAACIRLLHQAVDGGVTYIDTAAAYGRSEELVGLAFGGHPSRPLIATKVALRDAAGDPVAVPDQPEHVRASVHRSLRLLQTDNLDILQIHSAADAFLHDELVTTMQGLVAEGIVGIWGASTYGLEAPADALEEAKLRVLQVAYNVLDRRLEEELLPKARRQGVAIVLRSVFLQGVLSDRRRQLPSSMASLARAADEVALISDQAGLSLSQLALRYVLFSDVGNVTIVGTAHAQELAQNLAASTAGPLPSDVVAALSHVEVEDSELLHPSSWPEQPIPSTR
ncbi:MAG: aldo/keto reductase [Candidatus Latescibacterota bacterium]|nr:aldo/keto reductase [Candidatus Latescibacterota bacterium]